MATKKLKKLIINGEAYNLPNNSDFVDLTTAQSVWWVKTFTSAPVVPSKTTAATNSWTAVATEAQVYKKQDTLTLANSPTSWHLVTWWANNKTFADGWAIPTWFSPESAWSTGQLLTKTSTWYDWSNAPQTYSEVTKSDMDTGTSTTPWVVAAKSISDYVKWKIANTYVYKGSKASYDLLPTTWNVVWDVWNVVAAYSTYPAGTNFAWDWTDWDALWGTIDTSSFVTTSWNQTINWTKTFWTSPVVPSKTSAATNTGTAIATEAQVYTVAQAIPTVNNATLTVTQNWTSVGTFTANASSNVTIATTDTTYESKSAASWGTAVSLVTTGEKYTWNNKASTSDIGNATITFKQWIESTAIWTMTANQSSNWTITFHDNVVTTQSDYDNLPSTKATDGNSYWIYESVA